MHVQLFCLIDLRFQSSIISLKIRLLLHRRFFPCTGCRQLSDAFRQDFLQLRQTAFRIAQLLLRITQFGKSVPNLLCIFYAFQLLVAGLQLFHLFLHRLQVFLRLHLALFQRIIIRYPFEPDGKLLLFLFQCGQIQGNPLHLSVQFRLLFIGKQLYILYPFLQAGIFGLRLLCLFIDGSGYTGIYLRTRELLQNLGFLGLPCFQESGEITLRQQYRTVELFE